MNLTEEEARDVARIYRELAAAGGPAYAEQEILVGLGYERSTIDQAIALCSNTTQGTMNPEPFIEHWLNNEPVRAVQAAKRLSFERCVEAMIEDGFARPHAEKIASFLKNKQPPIPSSK